MKEKAKLAGKPGSVVGQPFLWARDCSSAQATYPRARRVASSLAYLVLLRVEVAAFHPCSAGVVSANVTGLVSVALFLALGAPIRLAACFHILEIGRCAV